MPICYLDMSFCPFWTDCAKGPTCYRAITLDVEKGAEEIGLPIAKYVDQPECYVPYVEVL